MSKIFAAAVSCVMVFGLACSAHGGGISVNFDGWTNQLVTGATGVVSLGNWNNVNATISGASLSSLKDDTGANLTGVNLTLSWLNGSGSPISISSPEWHNNVGGTINTPARELFKGMLDGNGSAATRIQVTNVPYAVYDVYVYHLFEIDHLFDLAVNGGTAQRVVPIDGAASAGADAFVLNLNDSSTNSNYTRFSNVTGDTLTILANNKAKSSAAMVGFQIVEAVPEPSGVAFAGMALAAALGFVRRRR